MADGTEIVVENNPNDMAQRATRIFTAAAVDCVSGEGQFTVVLSGGSTPRLMHNLLAEEPFSLSFLIVHLLPTF